MSNFIISMIRWDFIAAGRDWSWNSCCRCFTGTWARSQMLQTFCRMIREESKNAGANSDRVRALHVSLPAAILKKSQRNSGNEAAAGLSVQPTAGRRLSERTREVKPGAVAHLEELLQDTRPSSSADPHGSVRFCQVLSGSVRFCQVLWRWSENSCVTVCDDYCLWESQLITAHQTETVTLTSSVTSSLQPQNTCNSTVTHTHTPVCVCVSVCCCISVQTHTSALLLLLL